MFLKKQGVNCWPLTQHINASTSHSQILYYKNSETQSKVFSSILSPCHITNGMFFLKDLSDQCDTIKIPYISECIRVVIIFLHMSYLLSSNGCIDGIKVEWEGANQCSNPRVAGLIPSTDMWAIIWKQAGITSTMTYWALKSAPRVLHCGWPWWVGSLCMCSYGNCAKRQNLKACAYWQLSFLLVSEVKM